VVCGAGAKETSLKPVPAPFLVGVTRSGKTLLRLMLDSHPEMAIPPETQFIPRLSQRFGWSTRGRKPTASCFFARFFAYQSVQYVIYTRQPEIADPVELFLETVKMFNVWHDFHIDEGVLRSRLRGLEPFDLSGALGIFYRLYAERFGKSRWGDETPQYGVWMELIHGLLPEARFIHMIRDGRDVWVSERNLWFAPRSIQQSASRWVRRIQETRRQAQSVPYYCEIRYEELVLDPDRTLKVACEFIDLPWVPSMAEYYQRAGERLNELEGRLLKPDGTRLGKTERLGYHADLTREPSPAMIGLWKKELRASEVRAHEAIAGGMLKDLGYETSGD
jgi:hypothetical protein